MTALIVLGACVMMSILAYPFLTNQIYLEDDLSAVFVPFRYFYAQCLKHDESFLWIPNVYNGFYLHGETQNGMTHPLHLVLYKSLPFTQAFDLELLLSYPFMFAGAILLMRRWGLPLHAALFGALLFTFSGYSTSRWIYLVHIGVLAHAPWLLYCLDVAMRSPSARRVVAATAGVLVLTASALLVGYPHIVFIIGLVEGLYVLFLLRTAPHRWAVWLLLAAKVLAVGLAAIQLLPTLDLALHSARAHLGFEARMWGSQHPLNLLQLVNPYFAQQRTFRYVGYETFYGGAAVTVLAAWLTIRFRRLTISRTLTACFLVTAILGAVLVLGRYGYLYRLMSVLPIFNMFRGAARHGVMFHIGWVALGALGYTELYRLLQRGEKAAWRELAPLGALPLLSGGVAALVVVAHGLRDTSAFFESLHDGFAPSANALAGAAIMIVATALFIAAARGRRYALTALLIFTMLDLGVYGLRHKTVGRLDTFIEDIEVPPGTAEWAYAPNYLPTYNVMGPLMKGYRTPAGRASIEPVRRFEYYLDETQLRLAGVKWLRSRIGTNKRLNRFAEQGIEWIELADPMPRARLVAKVIVTADPVSAIETIDLSTTALVEFPLELMQSVPGSARIIEDRPGLMRVETRAPSAQLLVLTESYYPGWRVEIDGVPTDALRVNGDFLGCMVDPGRRDVQFRFEPESWRRGKMLTAASGVLALVFYLALFGAMSLKPAMLSRRNASPNP